MATLLITMGVVGDIYMVHSIAAEGSKAMVKKKTSAIPDTDTLAGIGTCARIAARACIDTSSNIAYLKYDKATMDG